MTRAFVPPDALTPDDRLTIADVRRAVWTNGLFGTGVGMAAGTVGHVALQRLQRKYVGEARPGSSSEAAQAARTAARRATDSGSLMYRCLSALPPLGSNTFLLALLGGGALGGFVMSTTAGEFLSRRRANVSSFAPCLVEISNPESGAGKNAVHLLHPIFDVGRNEHAGKSPYQIAVAEDRKAQDGEGAATAFDAADAVGDGMDADRRRARSLRRRASIKHRLESGQSLSDAHGSTWPHDPRNDSDEARRDRATHRAEVWGRRQTERRNAVRDRIEHGTALSDATGGRWSGGSSGG